LAEAEERLVEVDRQLSDPTVAGDPDQLRTLGQERAELEPIVRAGRELLRLQEEYEGALELAQDSDDPEMQALAEEEVEGVRERLAVLSQSARELLVPSDPLEDRPAVVEVRAGTGGSLDP
jgi:peptide chain release factor 1